MKSLILVISIGLTVGIISCNKDGCGGGRNASSEPVYSFDVYYIDRSTGENLLGMDEQTIADNEVLVTKLENGIKQSIGENFALSSDFHKGHFVRVIYYEAGHSKEIFVIEVADFPADTVIMDYDRGEEKIQLWYKGERLVNRDKCDKWEIPQIISYQ